MLHGQLWKFLMISMICGNTFMLYILHECLDSHIPLKSVSVKYSKQPSPKDLLNAIKGNIVLNNVLHIEPKILMIFLIANQSRTG